MVGDSMWQNRTGGAVVASRINDALAGQNESRRHGGYPRGRNRVNGHVSHSLSDENSSPSITLSDSFRSIFLDGYREKLSLSLWLTPLYSSVLLSYGIIMNMLAAKRRMSMYVFSCDNVTDA